MPEILATFPRENGQSVVLTRGDHAGRPYFSLRLVEGETQLRSLSLRWVEVAALADVFRKLTAADPADEQPRFVDKGTRPQPSGKPASSYSTPTASPVPFDEFGGNHD